MQQTQRCTWETRLFIIGLFLLSFVRPTAAYEGIVVVNGGTVFGQVRLRGTIPSVEKLEITKDEAVCGKTEKLNERLVVGPSGGVQNAVIIIENIQRGKRQLKKRGIVLDQKECRYVPHVVLVPVGASLTIQNSDGILHNLHSHSEINPAFNKPQPRFKKTIKETFAHAEIVKLTCDAHTWMSGWIVVHEHPYYAVTDENGSFSLSDVPSGDYLLRIWHESLGERRQAITVAEKSKAEVLIEF